MNLTPGACFPCLLFLLIMAYGVLLLVCSVIFDCVLDIVYKKIICRNNLRSIIFLQEGMSVVLFYFIYLLEA